MSGTTTPNLTNDAIAAAKDLPSLYANLKAADPALAAQLVGGATSGTATPLGSVIAAGVVWVSSRYGLGWDESFCAVLSAAAVALGGYIAHALQSRGKKAAVVAAPTA